MASSIRQQIISAFVTRLKTITVANGYNLAIGTKVYDWRMQPLLPAGLPAIELRDGEDIIEVTTMDGDLQHTLTITVIVLASGATSATTVRSGLQDIIKALYTEWTFGGLVKSLTPESTNIELQQDQVLMAVGQLICSITYYTASGEI